MFSPLLIAFTICLYVGALFTIALLGERRAASGGRSTGSGGIYGLSLAVYCTTWTYYGSVGKAATGGITFLTIYLGPTLVMIFGWVMLRKLVRLKNRYRITSIADFISSRYDKSQVLAATATVIALIGSLPYIALQLKAVISSFNLITAHDLETASGHMGTPLAPVLVIMMIVFTVMFGVRRLDPTERHQGMVLVLAVECVVKLLAFLAAGIFVTFYVFDGFGDILARVRESTPGPASQPMSNAPSFLTWTTLTLLAASAFLFLPRQFHVAVVENSDEHQIRTAQWLTPLYMLLINVFVLPIALGGLLLGHPAHTADSFVLLLPLEYGQHWLSLLVFLGGFSAAMGMIVICTMTMSTMVTNHLLLPVIERVPSLGYLRRRLLQCRWVMVALFLCAGYLFTVKIGDSYMLVNMGLLSFAAVLQFAPAIVGGLFWRKGNKQGALLGMSTGFGLWFYTLLIPALAKSGWLHMSIVDQGPWGISLLRPEQFLGLRGFDPLSNAVFWSLSANLCFYVLGSILGRTSTSEEELRKEFIEVLEQPEQSMLEDLELDRHIPLVSKCAILESLFGSYFPSERAAVATRTSVSQAGIEGLTMIHIFELAQLRKAAENLLSGAIGAAAAFHAMTGSGLFTEEETRELSGAYRGLLARMQLSPAELHHRVYLAQERENLMRNQAEELETMVALRTSQLRQANSELTREITTRKEAQEQSERLHKELITASRQAGMAEVASNVLHNVGNILNSINVSVSCMRDGLNGMRVEGLDKATGMLLGQGEDLARFLSEDERGRILPTYLKKLAEQITSDRSTLIGELEQLEASVNHVNEVVRFQQNFAVSRHVVEELSLASLLEDAVRVVCPTASAREFEVKHEVDPELRVATDKHKVLQVLINLVRNAKQSVIDAYPRGGGIVAIRAELLDGAFRIEVEDNGVGIAPENLNRIFQHGFTTKDGGHGFGLHSSANAAKEMRGQLQVHSDGPGCGATFVFEAPILVALEATRAR